METTDLRTEFTKETKTRFNTEWLVYNDYVDWLEQRLLKLFCQPAVINWAYFNENKPSYGDQILIQDPPEQMTTPRVEVYDRTTEWIDGSRYAVITPCL